MGEHSLMDGGPVQRIVDQACDIVALERVDTTAVRNGLQMPQHLKFSSSLDVDLAIQTAKGNFKGLIERHDLKTLAWFQYGKNQIKKFKCSPDAFAQMAIQLAYRRMFGLHRPTYESTQTRKFLHGRTETTRSVSMEVKTWTDAMLKPTRAAAENEYKLKLLREACNSHVKYARSASNGLGCDRQLLAFSLLLTADEKRSPEAALFRDPIMAASKHWNISTSHLVSEHFDGWGWGEVVPDGLGVAYSVRKERINFNVTSCQGWAADFCSHLEKSLREMSDVCFSEGSGQARL